MPEVSPVIMVLVPVPVVLTPPGSRVRVHVPFEGRSFNTTLPVESSHVGWLMSPTAGAEGVGGCLSITTSSDRSDTQPSSFVTVKL